MVTKKSKNTQHLSKKMLEKAGNPMAARAKENAQNDAILKKIARFLQNLDLKDGDTMVFAFTRSRPLNANNKRKILVTSVKHAYGKSLSVSGLLISTLMAYERDMAKQVEHDTQSQIKKPRRVRQ